VINMNIYCGYDGEFILDTDRLTKSEMELIESGTVTIRCLHCYYPANAKLIAWLNYELRAMF
jgi:hypothetical protein